MKNMNNLMISCFTSMQRSENSETQAQVSETNRRGSHVKLSTSPSTSARTSNRTFPPGDAKRFFQEAVRKANTKVTLFRGDQLDKTELLSHQAEQQKKAKNPDYLKATQKILDKVYSDPEKLDRTEKRHWIDSRDVFHNKNVFRKKRYSGSPFVSMTPEKSKALRFATTVVTPVGEIRKKVALYELSVPRGAMLQNKYNSEKTGMRENEYLAPVSIPEKWIVKREEVKQE